MFSREQRIKLLHFRGSTLLIVTTISLAVFTDIFLYSIIIPVIPYAFKERMGVSEERIQYWITLSLAMYSVGLILSSVVFGYISDKIAARRTCMLMGLIVLIGSTFILCFGKSGVVYAIGRFIQGISAGVVWTAGLAIIADTAAPDKVALYMSFPGLAMSISLALGPLVGGIVYERAGYYAVFYVCFALLVVDVTLRIIMLEKRDVHKRLVKLGARDAPDTVGEEMLEESHLAMPVARVTIFMTGKSIRIPRMLLLLRRVRFLNVMLLSMILAWLFAALDATLTIHIANSFRFNSLQSGLVFLAIALPAFIEPLIGWGTDKYGPKYFVTIGFLVCTPSLILLRLPDSNSPGSVACFIVLLGIFGFCMSCVEGPVFAELTYVVAKDEARNPGIYGRGRGYGQAYGLFNVAFSIGSLIGPFEAGPLRSSQGWNTVCLSLGIIAAISAIPSFLFTGGNVLKGCCAKARPNANELYETDGYRQEVPAHR